jgi:hypothetical protein
MANLRVVGHFTDTAGKTLNQWGTGIQFLVSAAMRVASDGLLYPDPAAINAVLARNGAIPGGAVFAIDGVANLDRESNANILS